MGVYKLGYVEINCFYYVTVSWLIIVFLELKIKYSSTCIKNTNAIDLVSSFIDIKLILLFQFLLFQECVPVTHIESGKVVCITGQGSILDTVYDSFNHCKVLDIVHTLCGSFIIWKVIEMVRTVFQNEVSLNIFWISLFFQLNLVRMWKISIDQEFSFWSGRIVYIHMLSLIF